MKCLTDSMVFYLGLYFLSDDFNLFKLKWHIVCVMASCRIYIAAGAATIQQSQLIRFLALVWKFKDESVTCRKWITRRMLQNSFSVACKKYSSGISWCWVYAKFIRWMNENKLNCDRKWWSHCATNNSFVMTHRNWKVFRLTSESVATIN